MLDRRSVSGRIRSRRPIAERLECRALLAVAFAAEPTTLAGRTPTWVASADLNGDGKPDLVESYAGFLYDPIVPNPGLILRLGRGDGTFLPPTPIGSPPGPQTSIAFGDFNGDGRLDYVLVRGEYSPAGSHQERREGIPGFPFQTIYVTVIDPERPSTIEVFLNQGDGTFLAQPLVKVAPRPRAVAVADLNGDGKLDLVVDRSVFLGRGDGTFNAPTPIVVDPTTSASAQVLADVNGDGKLDLVEGIVSVTPDGGWYAGGQVDVRLGNGNGTFGGPITVGLFDENTPTPSRENTNPIALVVSDFNGDGKPDLAVLDRGLHVLTGLGDGTFGPDRAYDVGANPVAFVAGDFNRDGRLDIAVTAHDSNAVTVVRGNGDGTFEAPRLFGLGPGASSYVLGDLNGDGIPDLAFVSQGTLGVRIGLGDGTFGPTTLQSLSGDLPASLALADLNGDGKLDLVLSSQGIATSVNDHGVLSYDLSGNGLQVFLGRGDGSFEPPTTIAQPQRRSDAVRIADVNGDGIPDLIELFHNFDGTGLSGVGILPGRGDGTFGPAVDLGLGTDDVDAVAVGDLNGDGKPDLAVTNTATGDVSIRLNTGGSGVIAFGPATRFATGLSPGVLAIADLNKDGKPDLVVANRGDLSGPNRSTNGNVVTLAGRGDGTFLPAVVVDAIDGMAPTSLSVADLNSDGTPDIVVAYEPRSAPQGVINVLLGRANAPPARSSPAPDSWSARSSPARPSAI